MKVAYLTGQYPRFADTWLQREIAAVRGLGVDVRTFSVRAAPVESLVTDAQRSERAATTYLVPSSTGAVLGALAHTIRHPARTWRAAALAWRTRAPGLPATARQAAYLVEAMTLAPALRRWRADHLHNHLSDASCTVAMLASELSGCSFSFTAHGSGVFFEAAKWRFDEKVRRARFVACVSSFCKSQVACFSDPEDWSKLHVVHCGVAAVQPRVGFVPNLEPELLFVGRIDPRKGLVVLLDVVGALRAEGRPVRLSIVGDGPDRDAVARAVDDRGLGAAIDMLGPLSTDAIDEVLERVDALVMPSFAEGVPVVLMEAMARGVPVVATQVGGTAELIDDGISGELVPPFDAGALADAIRRLLDDPAGAAAMAERAVDRVRTAFVSEPQAEALVALMSQGN